jgi:alanine racemase
MATDKPLGNVATLGGTRDACTFFGRGFVSHSGCLGESGVLQSLFTPISCQPSREDRIDLVKSWVEISEKRLTGNYQLLKKAAGDDTAVLAVVKANAYGHGATVCAPGLARAGAPWLGVTDVAEGACVRKALAAAGIEPKNQPNILAMSGPLRHQLTPVVWQQEQFAWLSAAVTRHGSAPLPIHIEIDTGMARQGVAPGEDLSAVLQWLKNHATLQLDGVFTHFASSEVASSPQTLLQRKRFEQAIAQIAASGLRPTWVHAGNSSTVDNQGTEENLPWLRTLASTIGARSMVRPGIALYGYCLPIESANASTPPQPEIEASLQPVMTWKTRIIGLRDIHPGDSIGYNGIFAADKPMRLALLPIGYADGLRRELSASNTRPGGWAMIHGKPAPYVGRVSMNLTIIDVTEIAAVSEIKDLALGDEVVVLGDGITADDHAHLANTIAYEIVCGVRASSQLTA